MATNKHKPLATVGGVGKTTESEFLEEIAALTAALAAEIQSHQLGLDPSPAARLARRRRVLLGEDDPLRAGDFGFFCHTYFPHHLRPPASLFHKHAFTRAPLLLASPSGAKEWWIAPRGEGKSSIFTKLLPCFVVVRAMLQAAKVRAELGWVGDAPNFIDYVVLLGAETRLPTKLIEVVKTELTVNAALAADFPEACGRGVQWKIGEFVSRNNVKFESFGAEQAIRGTFHGASRPKLLIGDDLITDKEAKSPTERENRWEWLEKAIDYLGPPGGLVKFIGVGTVLNKDDPTSRAKRTVGHLVHHFRAIETFPVASDLWAECEAIMLNDDKGVAEAFAARGEVAPDEALPSYKFYAARRKQMDKGAVISWPGVRSLFYLMRQRVKNGKAFATEMQGDPRSDEDKVFTTWKFWVLRSDRWLMLGGCDPSVGQGQSSDPSAILVAGWDRQKRQLNLVEAAIKRRVVSKLRSDLITAQRAYRMRLIGFENNGAFEAVRSQLIEQAIDEGIALPLRGINTSGDLTARIDGLEPFITDAFDPRILFAPNLVRLLAELDSWPEPQPDHHYDGLSALEILWTMACTCAIGGTDGFHSMSRTTGQWGGQSSNANPSAQRQRRSDDDYSGGGSRRMF